MSGVVLPVDPPPAAIRLVRPAYKTLREWEADIEAVAQGYRDGRITERAGYLDCYLCGKPVDLAVAYWAGTNHASQLPAHRACVAEFQHMPIELERRWVLAHQQIVTGKLDAFGWQAAQPDQRPR